MRLSLLILTLLMLPEAAQARHAGDPDVRCRPILATSSARLRAYCRGDSVEKGTEEWIRTERAIDNIYARGGTCEVLADIAYEILDGGEFRYFSPSDAGTGRLKSFALAWKTGERSIGVRFDLVYWFYGTGWRNDEKLVDLEAAIAHEAEHFLHGAGHPGDDPVLLPNTLICSGQADD